ncbi:MAG TPA: DUF1259 domain-containing protein [Gemmatimonadaceae bacterium]
MKTVIILAAAALVNASAGAAQKPASYDWTAVDRAMGRSGAPQPGGVRKFGFARSDLHVTVHGVAIRPPLALGSWVAFRPMGDGRAMVTGDLVLTEDEIDPVISRLQEGGVEQSALHNHLLAETPRVMYMHVMAHGDAVRLAQTVHAALLLTKTPLAPPSRVTTPLRLDMDTIAAARVLGHAGTVNNGVYQVSVPRREKIREGGIEVPPSMGVATGINIQPIDSTRAVATGDFVLLAGQVNPVIRALHANGITMTALHSHMLGESPRLFFMHFWADDSTAKVLAGLKAALSAAGQ